MTAYILNNEGDSAIQVKLVSNGTNGALEAQTIGYPIPLEELPAFVQEDIESLRRADGSYRVFAEGNRLVYGNPWHRSVPDDCLV